MFERIVDLAKEAWGIGGVAWSRLVDEAVRYNLIFCVAALFASAACMVGAVLLGRLARQKWDDMDSEDAPFWIGGVAIVAILGTIFGVNAICHLANALAPNLYLLDTLAK